MIGKESSSCLMTEISWHTNNSHGRCFWKYVRLGVVLTDSSMKSNKTLLRQVQQAICRNKRLKNCLENIYVMINEGAVIISGSVPSADLKKVALEAVRNIPGASIVIDDLRIEPPGRHSVSVQIGWAKRKLGTVK